MKQNLSWIRITIGALSGFVLWFIWQASTATSPEMESVKFRFLVSPILFGPNCAATVFQAGGGTDWTTSNNLLLFLPFGISFGIAFAVLKPLPRFYLWTAVLVITLIAAEYAFEAMHIIMPFGGPLTALNCLYLCGTLIFLESQKIEHVRSLALDLQMQAEEERKRIAKDLHDEALPSLSRVMRLTDELQTQYPDNTIPSDIRSILETTVAEMRRVINDLHPAVLENLGIVASLQHLSDTLANHSGINSTFKESVGSLQLPQFHSLSIYRIVQEALNNVEKHSGAKNVILSISKVDSSILVSITDDGTGQPTKRAHSHGLQNIEHRAKLIGGMVSWQQSDDFATGTKLVLTMPIPEDASSSALKN